MTLNINGLKPHFKRKGLLEWILKIQVYAVYESNSLDSNTKTQIKIERKMITKAKNKHKRAEQSILSHKIEFKPKLLLETKRNIL